MENYQYVYIAHKTFVKSDKISFNVKNIYQYFKKEVTTPPFPHFHIIKWDKKQRNCFDIQDFVWYIMSVYSPTKNEMEERYANIVSDLLRWYGHGEFQYVEYAYGCNDDYIILYFYVKDCFLKITFPTYDHTHDPIANIFIKSNMDFSCQYYYDVINNENMTYDEIKQRRNNQ